MLGLLVLYFEGTKIMMFQYSGFKFAGSFTLNPKPALYGFGHTVSFKGCSGLRAL